MIHSRKLPLTITATALLISGCGTINNDSIAERTRGWSEQRLYNAASDELTGYDFDEAAEYLEQLDAQYPNSQYSQQAILDLAYAYYKDQNTDLAILTAERFIETYPNHPQVDYAYYIRGIANYDRGFGVVSKIFPPNEAKTDQSNALQTFRFFSELVERFPNSRYAEDARQRMAFIRNNLSKHEVLVGNYYLERYAYVAAANRGKTALQNFASAPSSKAALAIMVEAYTMMRQPDLAKDAYETLAATYPDSRYTKRSAEVIRTKTAGPSMEAWIEDL